MSKKIYKMRKSLYLGKLISLHTASKEKIQKYPYIVSISKRDNSVNVIWRIRQVQIGTTLHVEPIYGRAKNNFYTYEIMRNNPTSRPTIRYLATEAGVNKILSRSKHVMYKYE